ncbi:MAG: hypothetical protein U5L06_00680 [Rhodovibrio sp.]|nr:hypothetical protein [Rhodovibrio sp.]
MKAVLIESGKVVNVAAAPDETWQPPGGETRVDVSQSHSVAVGWTWDGAELRPPAPSLTMAERRADAAEAVNNAYVACLRRGVTWNGTRWTATDAGRDTLVELHEVAKQDGVSVTVLDANSAAHTLSEADLASLRDAGRTYRRRARERRLSLLQAVEAAASTSDVEAIDETSGWPG